MRTRQLALMTSLSGTERNHPEPNGGRKKVQASQRWPPLSAYLSDWP